MGLSQDGCFQHPRTDCLVCWEPGMATHAVLYLAGWASHGTPKAKLGWLGPVPKTMFWEGCWAASSLDIYRCGCPNSPSSYI